MEFLKDFELRPEHPDDPQVDLHCVVADARDLAQTLRREVNQLASMPDEVLAELGFTITHMGDQNMDSGKIFRSRDLFILLIPQGEKQLFVDDWITVSKGPQHGLPLGEVKIFPGYNSPREGKHEIEIGVPNYKEYAMDHVSVPLGHNRFNVGIFLADSEDPQSLLSIEDEEILESSTKAIRNIVRRAKDAFSS